MAAEGIEGSGSDDEPQLSEHALAALREFYAERVAFEEQRVEPGIRPVEEDWQLSQFWYDDVTAQTLAAEALRASQHRRIACIACPTLFAKLVDLKPLECEVVLLEFDRRFELYGESFVFYDYKEPLSFPPEILQKNSFDLVAADPPFLSEECLKKVAQTIRHLAKDKVLICTGAVMGDLVFKLLGAHPCTFVPRHTRNLANEFRCYANYQTCLEAAGAFQDKS